MGHALARPTVLHETRSDTGIDVTPQSLVGLEMPTAIITGAGVTTESADMLTLPRRLNQQFFHSRRQNCRSISSNTIDRYSHPT